MMNYVNEFLFFEDEDDDWSTLCRATHFGRRFLTPETFFLWISQIPNVKDPKA
jgi:hypothetical protein